MIHITKIYLVTNCHGDPNKIYIGKTKTSREFDHKRKFGEQIEYTYIDEINSRDRKDWKPLETYWIQQFKAWGFNVLNKNEGGGGVGFHTEETKQKISKNNKKKKRSFSEETKEKMSVAKKGIPKPKGFGEKVKNNRDNVSLGEKLCKPITQYTLDNVFIKNFPSTKKASQETNISDATICNCLKGKGKSAGGYIWKYM